MIRIAAVNVNGVRAAWRKGMSPWLESAGAEIVTLQEVRAPNEIAEGVLDGCGYAVYSADAEAKGRAGVAVLSRSPADAVRVGIGEEYFARSGRWIETDHRLADGSTLTVVSAYVHSGEAGTPKQDDKYRFLDRMLVRLPELRAAADHVLVTGDLNVGHTELDIKNWKANRKKAGFLPEERAYFDRFFGELGYVDVHRRLSGEVPSTRTPAGGSTTRWRRLSSPPPRGPPGSTGPRPGASGGATMPRSSSTTTCRASPPGSDPGTAGRDEGRRGDDHLGGPVRGAPAG